MIKTILINRIDYSNRFGEENEYRCLVIELLGPSLEDLFNSCKRQFSLKTILMLADQMILRLECFHRKFYLHRE
jgi:hypothetical protein